MPADRNVDDGPPLTELETREGKPLLASGFPSDLDPIYWGPGQLTGQNGLYLPPDPAAWHDGEPLRIPRVVRFTFGTRSTYDPDDYDDGPDAPADTHTWRIEQVDRTPLPGPPDQPTIYRVVVYWQDQDAPAGRPTMSYDTTAEGLFYFLEGMTVDLPTTPFYVLGSEVNYDPGTGEYYYYNNGVYTVVTVNPPPP